MTEWIPVSERLPEEGVSVLGTFEFQGGRGCRTTERIIINGKEIWSAACGMEPIAWMPLPEPYKGENNHIKDCLSCANSFSEEGDENGDFLHCSKKGWAIVEEDGYCDEWNA